MSADDMLAGELEGQADATRRWQLELPDAPILTPNSRAHWRRRQERAQVWRGNAADLAAHLEVPRFDRIRVTLDHWRKDRRRCDPDRNALVVKWCIDGLVDAGVVDDDNYVHVEAVVLRMHAPLEHRRPVWLLTVEAAP